MVTATKTSNDSTINSLDFSYKASNTGLASKSTSELSNLNNTKSTSKSDDFKEVLNSKTNSKEQEDVQNVEETNKSDVSTEVKDTDDLDQLKEKLEELEEESKSDPNDKVKDILTEILSLLTKLGIKQEDLKSNVEVNSDVLKSILEGINSENSSNNNLNSIMEKITELLKSDSVKNSLDSDSLKLMEKILGNLSANIVDDNSEATKEIKSNMKNLMSEISNILENKQNESKKILTLEDLLNKNYSQNDSESSSESRSDNSTTSKDNKGLSKEDKFLNSLIDDSKDSSLDKINLFASRTSAIQNQGVNTVRGLTINKATFVGDLIKDVKYMSTNALKELTVKINPGNLGEITIKLIQEDGLMKANLKANSKETTALLSQNLVDIKKQLSEQNIKIADVNIELYQDDTTFFRDQGFGGQLSKEQGGNNSSNNIVNNNAAITEEELVSDVTSIDNNLDFFA